MYENAERENKEKYFTISLDGLNPLNNSQKKIPKTIATIKLEKII